jgi:nucleotide sugar dehydrogenase
MKICVVGLGNIGFNLFAFLCEKFPGEVIGVDVNKSRVNDLLRQGYKVTDNYGDLNEIDVWLMAPSTGTEGQNLFSALEEMIIRPGSLISIESTLPPGTMRQVRDFLEKKEFRIGRDVFLIHVPHRVMFGVDKTVCDTPRVMGAYTSECMEKGRQFYSPLVPRLIEVADPKVAELSKVVENVKRYVDIAFAQEIYSYCRDQGLDYDDLRRAVNSKSNVELLGTDWGIGGECLPKDLGFLRTVCHSPLLEGAELADKKYRDRIIQQIGTGKQVLIKGLSYKSSIKDLKHSRAIDLVGALEETGNTVWVEDPLFNSDELQAAGFNVEAAGDLENGDQQTKTEWIVLERQKALNPAKVSKGDSSSLGIKSASRIKINDLQKRLFQVFRKRTQAEE